MAATFLEESGNGWETEAFGFDAGLLPSEGSPVLGEGASFVPATFFGAAASFGVGALWGAAAFAGACPLDSRDVFEESF